MAGAARGNFQKYFNRGADHLSNRIENFNIDSNQKVHARMQLLHDHDSQDMKRQTERIDVDVDAINVEIQELELEIRRAISSIDEHKGELVFMNDKIEHESSKCKQLEKEMQLLTSI